ncbi:DNA-binding protein [Telluria mixta]|uniref:DNA-binding protein n=1 Tax=Telluria mixta TaxID=34071 RepID=A0ABT2C2N9_9BURK|nr:DNA-binding protein [Telluria mixta]WEM99337.1 DNA-binding protein [Telluria mixta]
MERLAMRSHVDTKTAADLLGRTPQTPRKWACYEDGPLRPMRVNGRLAWAVADIRLLLHLG